MHDVFLGHDLTRFSIKVMQTFPESVQDGHVTMKKILRNRNLITNMDILFAFVQAHPDVIVTPDEEGNLPLHDIYSEIHLGPEWADFPIKLFMNDEALRHKNNRGYLAVNVALHYDNQSNHFQLIKIGVNNCHKQPGKMPSIIQKFVARNPECLSGRRRIFELSVCPMSYFKFGRASNKDSITRKYIQFLLVSAFPPA